MLKANTAPRGNASNVLEKGHQMLAQEVLWADSVWEPREFWGRHPMCLYATASCHCCGQMLNRADLWSKLAVAVLMGVANE